jgi:hypothetical protein
MMDAATPDGAPPRRISDQNSQNASLPRRASERA